MEERQNVIIGSYPVFGYEIPPDRNIAQLCLTMSDIGFIYMTESLVFYVDRAKAIFT